MINSMQEKTKLKNDNYLRGTDGLDYYDFT